MRSSLLDKTFQVASFDLLYSSLPIKGARILLALLLVTLLFLSITNSGRPAYFLFSLTAIFLMFEAFYHFKLSRYHPEATGAKSWRDAVTVNLAKILLTSPHWDSASWLFSSLVRHHKIHLILARADFSNQEINDLIKTLEKESVDIESLMTKAYEYTHKEGETLIDETALLLALFEINPTLAKTLFDRELKTTDLMNIAFWAGGEKQKPFWEKRVETLGDGIGDLWSGGWTLETEQYTVDLSQGVVKGEVDGFLVGRKKEIAQIEEVLSRSSKRNILLLGDPGIGKASLVYALALRSLTGELSESLKYKRFLELDLVSLLSKGGGGELEARVKAILEELSHAGNVVVYIPELQNIVGAGGFDISSLLVGTLSQDKLQVIGTSDRAGYKQYIEQRASFSETFEKIDIEEPSFDDTVRILEGRTTDLERKHKVTVTFKAIFATVELSDRYLVDRVFPGKALDLLDEVCSAVALRKKSLVEKSDVESVLSEKTKVPVSFAQGDEANKLVKLEEILHQRIVSQNEAVTSISESIRRARTLVRTTKRPIGVFLFLGPTGVGKTETAKALAQVYFDSEEAIVRLDMSEFQEEESINRLIGPPPGVAGFGSGGQLTEAVRKNPFSLVLLDEMEKAHQKVQEAFLAIFDEGQIADSSGRKISFTNTIMIATSNAGAEFIREKIQGGESVENIKPALLEKLQREAIFKPEFLNRFDDVVVYKPLARDEVGEVVLLMVKELKGRLAKQDIAIELTDSAIAYLANKGYDPTYGARSLRRVVADELEGLVSKKILAGELKRGSTLTIDSQNGVLTSQ